MDEPTTTTIAVKLPPASEFPAPQAANYFAFAWGGPDVELIIGYIDMLHRFQPGAKPVEVTPLVTNRVFMSVQGFALLRSQLEQAAESMMEAGVPLNQLTPVRHDLED